ncbi:MAG: ATP-binding cassette domain-containing protein [Verrucomicrobia bacterium]|nr:ATP-binding cassette domain-containing protein [Verrucomicrobiota bacterium]
MIYVHNLWKSYRSIAILKGLTLTVPSGKTTIILGRSGVGKSVLLRQITALEQPDEGYIEVDGVRTTTMTQDELYSMRRNLGMLFQSSALFDSMTVGENVGFYLSQHDSVNKSELQDLVEEALNKVGLSGFQSKLPSELSGGQKRRTALARLIIYRPKVLLYDEPTTGLDPVTAMHINELIEQTAHELGATSLIVTHDMQSALMLGDYFALHHEGTIAEVNNKEHFLQSENPLIREFLNNAFKSSRKQPLFSDTTTTNVIK